MSLFMLDTAGDQNLLHKNVNKTVACSEKQPLLDLKPTETTKPTVQQNNTEFEDDDFYGLPPPSVDIKNIISEALTKSAKNISKTNIEIAYANECLDEALNNAKKNTKNSFNKQARIMQSDFNSLTKSFNSDAQLAKVDVRKELSKTNLTPGLEQQTHLPTFTKEKQRKLNRLERAKTKGANWYGLPAQELTDEVKNDLKILQMRSVLDPKHFYKKNDLKVLPKYFQMGTVLHSPLDYYNERDTRRNKKKSLVDELLADKEFQKFNKRKYNEILSRRDYYSRKKALKKLKKLKQ